MSSSISSNSESDDDITFTKETTGLKNTRLDDSLIDIPTERFIPNWNYDPSFIDIDHNQHVFATD